MDSRQMANGQLVLVHLEVATQPDRREGALVQFYT